MVKMKAMKMGMTATGLALTTFMLMGVGVSNASTVKHETKLSSQKSYTFVYIPQGAIPFYQAVDNGIVAASKKYGNITIKYQAPDSMTDNAAQLTLFNNAVANHVDGIIISPQNPVEFVNPIKRAEQAGIPVICVDTGVTPNVAYSYIATSNVNASTQVANYMAKLVKKKGTQLLLNFNHSSSTAIERQAGWEYVMNKMKGIKSLGVQLTNNDPGITASAVQTSYQRDNSLNLIFGTNYLTASVAAKFVQTHHLKGKVFVAGFDVDPGVVSYVKSGYIAATVVQYPFQMGSKALNEMMSVKAGKKVPKIVKTKVFILTPKNVHTKAAISAIGQYITGYKG